MLKLADNKNPVNAIDIPAGRKFIFFSTQRVLAFMKPAANPPATLLGRSAV
jgi:hypothetical protein